MSKHCGITCVNISILVALALSGCTPSLSSGGPKAVEGVLDLRSRDFEKEGPVPLRGEWLFRWSEFADPSEATETLGTPRFIRVPGYWKGRSTGGKSLDRYGYATYGLTVLMPEQDEILAVKVKDVQTAYVLYADENEILSAGVVGRNAGEAEPGYRNSIGVLPRGGDSLRLVMYVSNFQLRDGGIREDLWIGTEADLRGAYETSISIDLFLIGVITAMGLYHIVLFALRKTEKMFLYFGLFCLIIAVRSLIVGELHAYRLFSGLSWSALVRGEYVTFALAVPTFLTYIGALLPGIADRKVILASQVVGAAFALFVFLTPTAVFSRALYPYQAVTLACGGYAAFALIKASLQRVKGAVLLLAGFFFLFLLVVNDILYANLLIRTTQLLDWGLLIFLVSQVYRLARITSEAFDTIVEQNDEIVKSGTLVTESRLGLILGLAKLAEFRDHDTGVHLERIREYCRIIAEHLASHPYYEGYVTEEYVEDLYHSSILHDIGKVGVPDAILLKPGPLDDEEFNIIKSHPQLGGDTISKVEEGINVQSFLTLGKQIAYHHHEKWDGSGYPFGLRGKDIPLSARIVALADVYDALTSKRPYKAPYTHEQAKDIIVDGRNAHFDPVIVDAFLAEEDRFLVVLEEMCDED